MVLTMIIAVALSVKFRLLSALHESIIAMKLFDFVFF